jgi:ABC-2 type transport system permease protein
MRTIFNIAKIELSNLFYSPIAWLVLIVYVFQAALNFTSSIEGVEKALQLYPSYEEITKNVFVDLFSSVKEKLNLYVPLLTMGLISREVSSGSIKLLLSSPITVAEIVWGKFLAILSYGLLLLLLLLPFILSGTYAIHSIDISHALSGILAIFLMLCAYSAIGLFLSSLTSYQVVAAISTIIVLSALSYLGFLWRDIPLVKDLTYYLSLNNRISIVISGLILAKDVCYFLLITALFVGFTMIKLHFDRESKPVLFRTSWYLGYFAVILVAVYISSRPTFKYYYDATSVKRNLLSQGSQHALSEVKSPLTVTTYANLLDNDFNLVRYRNRNSDFESNFLQYNLFLPKLELKYVYYYDQAKNDQLYNSNPGLSTQQLAAKVAKAGNENLSSFLNPEQIKRIINLSPYENRMVRKFEMNGKSTVMMGSYDDIGYLAQEKEFTTAIKRLLVEAPKVVFLTGHNERSITRARERDYPNLNGIRNREAFRNRGFVIDSVDLEKGEIADDVTLLVIADPRDRLSESSLRKIGNYITQGRNLLILGEADKAQILAPIISPLGIRFNAGCVLHQDINYKDLSPVSVLAEGKNLFNGPLIYIPGTSGLSYRAVDGYKTRPAIVGNQQTTWIRPGTPELKDSTAAHFSPQLGDYRSDLPLGVSLEREVEKRHQKILVIADADFLTPAGMKFNTPYFTEQIFSWFSDGNFPVDTSRPRSADFTLKIKSEGVIVLKILLMGVLPGIILLVGTMLLIRRRRH